MKSTLFELSLVVITLSVLSPASDQRFSQPTKGRATVYKDLLITPGKGIGLATLGDTEEAVLRHFPFKEGVHSRYTYACPPMEIEWLAPRGKTFDGNLRFLMRDRILFQIEVSS